MRFSQVQRDAGLAMLTALSLLAGAGCRRQIEPPSGAQTSETNTLVEPAPAPTNAVPSEAIQRLRQAQIASSNAETTLGLLDVRREPSAPADASTPKSGPPEPDPSMELYNQGVRFFFGDGVEMNLSEAIRCFKEAAELGNAGANHNLGVMHLKGQGVELDLEKARAHLTRAAEKGLAEAQFKLASLYASGAAGAKDLSAAAEWVRRAAQQGHHEAQYNLATMYVTGAGVAQDIEQAAQWYLKAAKQGHATAQSNIGVFYASGRGVPRDDEEATRWFERAAEKGNATAQFNLARAYLEGTTRKKDPVEAYKWFSLAAQAGDADAARERLDLSLEMSASDLAEAVRRANAYIFARKKTANDETGSISR